MPLLFRRLPRRGRSVRLAIAVEPRNLALAAFRMPSGGDAQPVILTRLERRVPSGGQAEVYVRHLQEFLFEAIKRLELIPERTVIAVGPNLGSVSLGHWCALPSEAPVSLAKARRGSGFEDEEPDRDRSAWFADPVRILADGYVLPVPPDRDFYAREWCADAIVLSVPETVVLGLTKLRQSFGGMVIEFIPPETAHAFAAVTGLRFVNGLMVVVNEYDSSVLLFRDSYPKSVNPLAGLVGVARFPLGCAHFYREVSVRLGVPPREGIRLIQAYARNILEGDQKESVHRAAEDVGTRWKAYFEQALDGFYHIGPLPAGTILTGAGAFIPELRGILEDSSWLEKRSDISEASVRIMRAIDVFGGNSLSGAFAGPEGYGLAALVFYAMRHERVF